MMVYSRQPLEDTSNNTDTESAGSTSPSPHKKKKKRCKLPANNIRSSISPKKFYANRAKEEERLRKETSNDSEPSKPVIGATSQDRDEPQAAELFVFDRKAYKRARTLFSLGFSTSSSTHVALEDRDIPATLRWNEVVSLLASPPISCQISQAKGAAIKVIRPARDGVPGAAVNLHKPHGGNPKCEREVLENIAGQLMHGFGWRKDQFVCSASPEKRNCEMRGISPVHEVEGEEQVRRNPAEKMEKIETTNKIEDSSEVVDN